MHVYPYKQTYTHTIKYLQENAHNKVLYVAQYTNNKNEKSLSNIMNENRQWNV